MTTEELTREFLSRWRQLHDAQIALSNAERRLIAAGLGDDPTGKMRVFVFGPHAIYLDGESATLGSPPQITEWSGSNRSEV